MKDINRIMIALDNTPMDETLIQYGMFIGKVLHANLVEFVHVVDEEEREQHLLEDLDGGVHKFEDFRNSVHKKAKQAAEGESLEVMVHVLTGSAFQELLTFAKSNDIDMVVVGKKEEQDGSGILAHRFSAKSPCSVLFVPPRPEYRMDAIMLPTDFSEYSAMAIEKASFFREKYEDIRLLATHIYRVPLGYYSTGKSYEEFAEIMRKNSEEEYERYVKQNKLEKLNLEPIYALADDQSPGELIHDIAIREGADLVIIGARGHSKMSSVVLGSTTEKLLRITKKIPVLVLKKKGETLKLLDILMNI